VTRSATPRLDRRDPFTAVDLARARADPYGSQHYARFREYVLRTYPDADEAEVRAQYKDAYT
jgi:hypothetical protein